MYLIQARYSGRVARKCSRFESRDKTDGNPLEELSQRSKAPRGKRSNGKRFHETYGNESSFPSHEIFKYSVQSMEA